MKKGIAILFVAENLATIVLIYFSIIFFDRLNNDIFKIVVALSTILMSLNIIFNLESMILRGRRITNVDNKLHVQTFFGKRVLDKSNINYKLLNKSRKFGHILLTDGRKSVLLQSLFLTENETELLFN